MTTWHFFPFLSVCRGIDSWIRLPLNYNAEVLSTAVLLQHQEDVRTVEFFSVSAGEVVV